MNIINNEGIIGSVSATNVTVGRGSGIVVRSASDPSPRALVHMGEIDSFRGMLSVPVW